jgi:hypothetical protein
MQISSIDARKAAVTFLHRTGDQDDHRLGGRVRALILLEPCYDGQANRIGHTEYDHGLTGDRIAVSAGVTSSVVGRVLHRSRTLGFTSLSGRPNGPDVLPASQPPCSAVTDEQPS